MRVSIEPASKVQIRESVVALEVSLVGGIGSNCFRNVLFTVGNVLVGYPGLIPVLFESADCCIGPDGQLQVEIMTASEGTGKTSWQALKSQFSNDQELLDAVAGQIAQLPGVAAIIEAVSTKR